MTRRYGTLVIAIGAVITLGLSRLEPAAPSVDRGTVYTDTVKRGEMLRQVRGLGKLVPEEIRWIPSRTAGMVERIGEFYKATPRKRLGDPAQLDSTLLYLCAPSSECVTGTIIKVDDGQGSR